MFHALWDSYQESGRRPTPYPSPPHQEREEADQEQAPQKHRWFVDSLDRRGRRTASSRSCLQLQHPVLEGAVRRRRLGGTEQERRDGDKSTTVMYDGDHRLCSRSRHPGESPAARYRRVLRKFEGGTDTTRSHHRTSSTTVFGGSSEIRTENKAAK